MGRAKKSVEVEAQVIARGNVVPMMTETESEETVQYVSDEDAAREDRLVSEIRMITEQTKQVVLFNSIEIGRRLTEAKAMVKRGTWGTWLKERVDYSQRTANNFMKIYQEYGRNGLAEKSQVIPYRIYPVLSPAWKADGYDELGIIYDRYLDLLVTYVVEGESETDGYAAAIVTYDNLDTFGCREGSCSNMHPATSNRTYGSALPAQRDSSLCWRSVG